MFHPFKIKGQIMAYILKRDRRQIVYGTRFLKRSDLRELFPDWQFCFVKQVHGNHVISAERDKIIEADGHWTAKKHEALAIHTADCLPVFLIKGSAIAALHIGWRGVGKKILISGLKILPKSDEPLLWSVGPHILQKNFTVHEETAQKLAVSSPLAQKFIQKKGENQWSVSLLNILKDQMPKSLLIQEPDVLKIDTFSSNLFHSFRKTAEKNKGQISFIVQI